MPAPNPSRFVCPECGAKYEAPGKCSSEGAVLARTDDDLLGYPIGSYRIVSLINAAGMGRVYKAVQPSIGARVAVKVLSPELAAKPDLVERFFAEARAVNIIRHEQIINIIDLALLPDGRPYIVMEYLDGATLADTMRYYGQCPVGSFANLVVGILGALAAAHARGIVHRDLKPSNVFVSPQGRPKVLDFGIAKLDPNLGGNLTATNPGQVMGTPAYMAPEQALGRAVDARADVYAMGVILYEGVVGKVPFDGDTIYSVLHQVLTETPRSPSELRPGLPIAYEQIIYRALAKDPVARFQTARDMANALSAVVQTLPGDAFGAILPPEEALAAASLPIRPTPGSQRRSAPASPVAPSKPGTASRAGRKLALIGTLAALASVAVVIALAVSGEPSKAVADARAGEHVLVPPPSSTSAPDATPAAPRKQGPPPELAASKTSDGFVVNLRFAQPPDEVEWKLSEEPAFRSNGDRTWIALPPSTGHAQILVRYLRGKDWSGPFPLVFDPLAIALSEAREALAAFPRWVTLSVKGHKRTLGFAALSGYRAALRAILYGFDEDVPSRTLPDNGRSLEVPAGAHFVTVQITFADGSLSDIRRFELGGNEAVPAKVVPAQPPSLLTGVDECDAIFTAVTECYRKTLTPDAFEPAAVSLGQSAGVIRDLVNRGTPREDVVRTCRGLRETYREASKGRGCEL